MRLKVFLFLGFLFWQFAALNGQTYLETAVNFTVEDVDGNVHELFDYLEDGKYVVIDFFFTTCGPCIGSVPILSEAFEKYGCNTEDVFFLGINYGESNFDLFNYVQDYGYLLPAASGWQGGANEVVFDYGIYAFPTVILIAPDKQILHQDIFPVTAYNLDDAIQNLAGIQPSTDGCLTVPTSTLEIPEDAGLNSLSIFPNPVQGNRVHLKSNLRKQETMKLEIFSVHGQLVAVEQRLEMVAGELVSTIDLPVLQAGVYHLKVTNEDGLWVSLPMTVIPE